MRSLTRRLKALEDKRGVEGPLVVMRMYLDDFTPEEVALFEADDNRQIREAEAGATGLRVLALRRDRERLAKLKEHN